MSRTEVDPPPDTRVATDSTNDRTTDTGSPQTDSYRTIAAQSWQDMSAITNNTSGTKNTTGRAETSSQNPEIRKMLDGGFGIDFSPPTGGESTAFSAGGKGEGKKEEGKKEEGKKEEGKKDEKKSFFDVPYDPAKADKLIKDLGSDEFATREKAQNTLERMGPQALDKLKGAAKSDDLEVQRRAERAIQTIQNTEHYESRQAALDNAKKLGPDAEKMLNSLGISYDRQMQMVADGDGNVSTIGPSFVTGRAGKAPSAEQQKEIDKTLKALDAAGSGTKKLSKLEKSEQENALQDHGTEKLNDEAKANFANMRLLDMANNFARPAYAEALSKSAKAEDKAKAINVLTDHMNKQENFKPDQEFNQLARSIGADKNAAFTAALERRSGKSAVEALRKRDE